MTREVLTKTYAEKEKHVLITLSSVSTCFNYIEFCFIEVLLYGFYLFNIKKKIKIKKNRHRERVTHF